MLLICFLHLRHHTSHPVSCYNWSGFLKTSSEYLLTTPANSYDCCGHDSHLICHAHQPIARWPTLTAGSWMYQFQAGDTDIPLPSFAHCCMLNFSDSPPSPSRQSLQSAVTNALLVRPTRYATVCARAFPVAAAKLWNELRVDVIASKLLTASGRRLASLDKSSSHQVFCAAGRKSQLQLRKLAWRLTDIFCSDDQSWWI